VNLRSREVKVLSTLEKLGGNASVEQLIAEAELSDAAVMRTALTLQEKSLVKIHAEPQVIVKLGAEGKTHAENGLPERRLLEALAALGGEAKLEKAAVKAGLDAKFKQIALGWIIRKKWGVYASETNTLRVKYNLLHQVLEDGKSCIVDDVEGATVDVCAREDTRSALASPIFFEGMVVLLYFDRR